MIIKPGVFKKPDPIRAKKFGTSFNTPSTIATTRAHKLWHLACLKEKDLQVKRVGWIVDNELIDDTDACLIPESSNQQVSETSLEHSFIHRLDKHSYESAALFWGNEGYSMLKGLNDYYLENKKFIDRFFRHSYRFNNYAKYWYPYKFSAIRLNNTVYVFPHLLFYFINRNIYHFSEEFVLAVMKGESITFDDIELYRARTENEFDNFKAFTQQSCAERHLKYYAYLDRYVDDER